MYVCMYVFVYVCMRVHIYTEYIYAHHLHVGLDIHPIAKFRNIFLVDADCDNVEHPVHDSFSVLQCVAICCSMLQCVAVCCHRS